MPTNVTSEYKRAEAAYKATREPSERLAALRDMLRTIPKHKGTEHVQADIKKKIKELNDQLAGPRTGAARGGPSTTIRSEGAGQISLIGPPNSGKSRLHNTLTGSHAATGPYAFTTLHPQPGMLTVDDVGIQLIDLPPIAREHAIPWLANAIQPADGALLVVDLSHPGCVASVADLIATLADKKVILVGEWPRGANESVDPSDPFVKILPTAIVAARAHEIDDVDAELSILIELLGLDLPTLRVSVVADELEHVGRWLFDALGVVRVYTETATKKNDRPYTIRRGQTVIEVAALIHKDLAEQFRFARLVRSGEPDRQVGGEFNLKDGYRIGIHA